MIPEKLYGREHEIGSLLAGFDRVLNSGTPELVLVSGYAGIGKSSVVNEVHKALVPPRGLFASGKFDQYKRDIPYATLVQAFQSLVRPFSARATPSWRAGATPCWRRLARTGSSWSSLIPELKLVIGEQPAGPRASAAAGTRAGFSWCFGDSSAFSPGRTSAGAVSRRPAMARRGDARSAGASADAVRPAAPPADRRLSRQRGRCHPSAAAEARDHQDRRRQGLRDQAGAAQPRASRATDCGRAALRDGAGRTARGAGAREDGRQSVLRHSVPVCRSPKRSCSPSTMTTSAGPGMSTAFTPRATPRTSSISWSESSPACRPKRRMPCSSWRALETPPTSRPFPSFSGRRSEQVARQLCFRPSARSWSSA